MQHPQWLAGRPTYLPPPPPPLLSLRIRPNHISTSQPARLSPRQPAPARLSPIRPIPRYPTWSRIPPQPQRLLPNQAPAPTRLLPFMPMHQHDGPHHIARKNTSLNMNFMTSQRAAMNSDGLNKTEKLQRQKKAVQGSHVSRFANQPDLVIAEPDIQSMSRQDSKTQEEEEDLTMQPRNRGKQSRFKFE